jgi:hypothetical protein
VNQKVKMGNANNDEFSPEAFSGEMVYPLFDKLVMEWEIF